MTNYNDYDRVPPQQLNMNMIGEKIEKIKVPVNPLGKKVEEFAVPVMGAAAGADKVTETAKLKNPDSSFKSLIKNIINWLLTLIGKNPPPEERIQIAQQGIEVFQQIKNEAQAELLAQIKATPEKEKPPEKLPKVEKEKVLPNTPHATPTPPPPKAKPQEIPPPPLPEGIFHAQKFPPVKEAPKEAAKVEQEEPEQFTPAAYGDQIVEQNFRLSVISKQWAILVNKGKGQPFKDQGVGSSVFLKKQALALQVYDAGGVFVDKDVFNSPDFDREKALRQNKFIMYPDKEFASSGQCKILVSLPPKEVSDNIKIGEPIGIKLEQLRARLAKMKEAPAPPPKPEPKPLGQETPKIEKEKAPIASAATETVQDKDKERVQGALKELTEIGKNSKNQNSEFRRFLKTSIILLKKREHYLKFAKEIRKNKEYFETRYNDMTLTAEERSFAKSQLEFLHDTISEEIRGNLNLLSHPKSNDTASMVLDFPFVFLEAYKHAQGPKLEKMMHDKIFAPNHVCFEARMGALQEFLLSINGADDLNINIDPKNQDKTQILTSLYNGFIEQACRDFSKTPGTYLHNMYNTPDARRKGKRIEFSGNTWEGHKEMIKQDRRFWKEFASKDKFIEFAKTYMGGKPLTGNDRITLSNDNISKEVTEFEIMMEDTDMFGPKE